MSDIALWLTALALAVVLATFTFLWPRPCRVCGGRGTVAKRRPIPGRPGKCFETRVPCWKCGGV